MKKDKIIKFKNLKELRKRKPIKNAIISAYKKEGIEQFAEFLQEIGTKIYSTGNTAKYLKNHGIEVNLISSITKYPEILDGRVKTLHPVIHGGILARRDNPEDMKIIEKLEIPLFDLIYIDLYPFEQKLRENIHFTDIEEFIDIGGPTMLRAAAKNYRDVVPVIDKSDLSTIQFELIYKGKISKFIRLNLARKVFNFTAYYDSLIHSYFSEKINIELQKSNDSIEESHFISDSTFNKDENSIELLDEKIGEDKILAELDSNKLINKFKISEDKNYKDLEYRNYMKNEFSFLNSRYLTIPLKLKMKLRYGENPHQKANFYIRGDQESVFENFEQIHGKELSFNNIKDIDVAWKVVSEFDRNSNFNFKVACCGVKHNTPCSIALGIDTVNAFSKMYMGDSISIFGGIVAFNSVVNKETAEKLSKIFLEIIIAYDFTEDALKILKKKKNLRLLRLKDKIKIKKNNMKGENYFYNSYNIDITSVNNGLLVQSEDNKLLKKFEKVTNFDNNRIDVDAKNNSELRIKTELEFAYIAAKYAKSNAIVVSSNFMTLGIGSGQQNRINAAKIALENAKDVMNKFNLKNNKEYKNLYLASDGFFPFNDVVELAGRYKVKAIIQPGGSIRDKDSIELANKLGISMYFTGQRHFKH